MLMVEIAKSGWNAGRGRDRGLTRPDTISAIISLLLHQLDHNGRKLRP